MAQYSTHFGSYSADVQPSDWFGRWTTTNSTWAARVKSATEGGQALEHTASADARRLLSWDAIDADADRADVEVLVRFRTSSATSFQNHIRVRGSGAAGTETAYSFFLGNGASTITVNKLVSGTGTTLATASYSWAANTWYTARFRVNGSSLKARIWKDGEAEPSTWQIETTDTAITAAGWVGVGAFTATGTRDYDFVGVATNGDTAPSGGESTTVRLTQAAERALLTDPNPTACLTQIAARVLVSPPIAARLTQAALRVLAAEANGARLTQAALRVLAEEVVNARLTQASLRTLAERTDVAARLTRAALRVLSTYTPPPAAWREYKAFIRFTVSSVDYGWGTVAEYRSSRWHEGIVADWPEPTDSFRDSFGLSEEDRVQVQIADDDNSRIALVDSLRGVEVDLDLVTLHVRVDGSREEIAYRRKGTVDAVSRAPGALSLEIVDLDRTLLEAEYPSKKFTVADFPELYTDDVGRPVPVVVGIALKVPFAYIQNNADAGPWVYAGPETLGSPTVLTVYREGRIVGASEYTAGTTTVAGTTYVTLTFTREQVDYQGSQMAITADLQSSLSRNAVDELKRLLTIAGASTDGSFSPSYAASEQMLVDIGYVEPRTLQAIVQDLLLVARGHLVRTRTGAWGLVQDQPQAVAASFDEDARDLVEIGEYRKQRRAKWVEVEYYPQDAARLLDLKHTIKRDTGAATGVRRFVAPYVRDHAAADRLLSYLAAKEQYAAEAVATVHDVQLPLGGVVRLTNSLLWSGAKSFLLPRVTRAEDANELELAEYVPAVYTYVPGTLPEDAVTGYQPDYSLTPPAAPTDLQVTSFGVALNEDGTAWAHVSVECRPPPVNWARVMFAVQNVATGETYIQQGEADPLDGTFRQTTFAALRPNSAHQLRAWAVNSNNVEGLTAGPVAFTTPTYGTAPAAPASIGRAQGIGKTIRVWWSAVAISNLLHYELQRNETTVATIKATEFVDVNVAYGSAYTYRVRAVDRFNNASGWTAASPITISGNVFTPDILDFAITTPKVAPNAITQGASMMASGSVSLSGTDTELASIGVSLGETPQTVFITGVGSVWNAGETPTDPPADVVAKVLRDSTVLATFTSTVLAGAQMAMPVMVSDTPGPGTYTYKIVASQTGGSSVGVADRAMLWVAYLR